MMTGTSCRNVATGVRRKAILEAALQLFLTKGFTDTTMEDIRQLSGASTGSIYHHFEKKENIATELYREGRKDLNATLLQSFNTNDPEEGLRTLVYNYLDWYEQSPDLGIYVIQAANTEYLGRYVEELRQSLDSSAQHFLRWLEPFIANNTIVRYPDTLYIPLCLGPSREFIRLWLRTRRPEQLQEARTPLAEAACQILLTHYSR
ncbi:transcriptional regulator [Ktedonobacteria bacterium brp13]|nr:transcriptional regulator [Ktedonobacteria bacterium brp13]